jgi:pyrimidine-nucleoside phosphorylase
MNQPLGEAVGNSLEVIEAINTLHGRGPSDFLEHCLHVCAHMLVLGKCATDLEIGRRMAEEALASGAAFEKFRVLVRAQEGDLTYVDDPDKFPKTKYIEVVNADRNGFLSRVNARTIGEASVSLGAGRAVKADPVDHAVGFIIHHKVGDHVNEGEPLYTIYANDATRQSAARDNLRSAYGWSEKPILPLPLFYN